MSQLRSVESQRARASRLTSGLPLLQLPHRLLPAQSTDIGGLLTLASPWSGGHAISAKRLSRLQRKSGNLTNDEFDRINRKADKVLDAELVPPMSG
jgi:hypothetical protein